MRGARTLPIFCNLSEVLQTLLFEGEVIINNAPLIYVCQNIIKTCLILNHLFL